MPEVAAPASTPLLIVVAAALIDGEGRVLVQQRTPGAAMAGLWEFPGGKVELGETPEAALVRELAEELAIDVDAAALMPCGFASEALGDRHLLLLLYLVRDWNGTPAPLQASALQWLKPSALRALPMPPADAPLVTQLEQHLALAGASR
jgi:8-oxo-dGTP diphosphatase